MNPEQQLEYYLMKIIKDLPEDLKFIESDIFIAGGAIVSLLQKETPNDIDVYFKTENIRDKFESIVEANNYFYKLINCYETKNVSLNLKIQFVIKVSDIPEKIIETFDFLHCKVYFDAKINKIIYGKHYENFSPSFCIQVRELILNPGCAYPIKALERMFKFIERKYSPHKSLFLDLPLKIHNLDLSSEEKLKEEVNGLYNFKNIDTSKVFKQLHNQKFNNKIDNILQGEK